MDIINDLTTEDLYNDEKYWLMEEGEEEEDTHVASITAGDGIPMNRTGQIGTNGK